MKLYFNPKSRALIAKWMLDECGAEYEIVTIDLQSRENKGRAYRQVNPAGKLPALVDGKVKLFENAAICMYLADKFPSRRLAPAVGTAERGRYLSLMVYSTAQLEPSLGDSLLKLPTAPSRGWTAFDETIRVVEGELGHGPWLLGAQFTAADVMIGSMFIWQRMFGARSGSAKIDAYVARLRARPAAKVFGR